ncbi:MAG TPA: hypothetical protein EYH11_01560 [Sulfurimonas autotrophica]|nr:hypothetical protein [Sulfurimonas autotrophica]
MRIPTNRFSKRINVLGFLNTQTKALFHTMTIGKVDTQVVIDIFDRHLKISKFSVKYSISNWSCFLKSKNDYKEKLAAFSD